MKGNDIVYITSLPNNRNGDPSRWSRRTIGSLLSQHHSVLCQLRVTKSGASIGTGWCALLTRHHHANILLGQLTQFQIYQQKRPSLRASCKYWCSFVLLESQNWHDHDPKDANHTACPFTRFNLKNIFRSKKTGPVCAMKNISFARRLVLIFWV